MLKDETDPATQNVRRREFQAKGLKQRKNFESWEQISDYVKPQLLYHSFKLESAVSPKVILLSLVSNGKL